MDTNPACQFHDASSLVFVGLAVFGGWWLERRRAREMQLTPGARSPTPWRRIVLFVWFTIAATYTVESALRMASGCTA